MPGYERRTGGRQHFQAGQRRTLKALDSRFATTCVSVRLVCLDMSDARVAGSISRRAKDAP